jgi:hypothetical protein
MTQFAYIRDRIEPFRDDLKPRQAQLAYQIACRQVAMETLALREFVVFTIPAGTISQPIYDPTHEKEALYIFSAKLDGHRRDLPLYNQAELEDLYHNISPFEGIIAAYTTDQGQFWPNRPPSADTQVIADVAYKPIGDFDEVNFGPEFEDPIVHGALSHYLALPGAGQDKAEARRLETQFITECSSLRGVNLVGDAGYYRASTTPKRHHFGQNYRSNMLRF